MVVKHTQTRTTYRDKNVVNRTTRTRYGLGPYPEPGDWGIGHVIFGCFVILWPWICTAIPIALRVILAISWYVALVFIIAKIREYKKKNGIK
jgi:hypothetical protein